MNDFYKPFIKPESDFKTSGEAQKHYVRISRWTTLLMMVSAVTVSFFFSTVRGGWEAILSIGAGTGLVYMLRWFWWRINAWSEISAMAAAAVASYAAGWVGYEGFADKMIFTMIITTAVWLAATFLTKSDDPETLQAFYNRVKPGGPGWKPFEISGVEPESLWSGIGMVVLSALSIIVFLYGMGQLFFGSMGIALVCTLFSIVTLWWIVKKI